MYELHYNYVKKKYGENAKLLMTDTDSFAYEIETEDFFKDISGDVETKFDTSAYPKNHASFSASFRQAVGKCSASRAGWFCEPTAGRRAVSGF